MLLSDKGINDLVDSGAIEGGRASSVVLALIVR